jgi:hypothetical protein
MPDAIVNMTAVMDQMKLNAHVVVQANFNAQLVNVSVKVENVIVEQIVEMEVMKLIVVSKTIELFFVK